MTSSGHIDKDKIKGADLESLKELPQGYGDTEAVLLARDPNWMYIYWEINEKSKSEIRGDYGDDIFQKARQVIRVYENSQTSRSQYFDIQVKFDAHSWYINVQDGGKSYHCELGLVLPNGKFVSVVKTNSVKLPQGKVSEITDEKWMSISGDFEKLLQLSGVEYIGKGSGEVAKSLAQRWEMLKSVFSRSASWGGASSLSSGNGKKPEDKDFWLVADCELILYGATHSDADVSVSGRKIKLNPDGTFSMRFALGEGKTDLPIKAISKDGSDKREIEIKISRATENQ
ncbi:MAG: DUF4912 domain-containing protein [Elusimicrobiales bacterium]|nr:DUF4912 domain-containing protein [Elusimicrobiales bacterium]MCK5105969.1 DUF4912 domain-containing protein [Elusimicrobiales bacterium]MCK5358528.1 DUF4912 domain-containing protein [Elusimicrobiales bacterium]MCK5583843.1 DUF4912 domain-containing protein [Elusimicrobiales bacterium]